MNIKNRIAAFSMITTVIQGLAAVVLFAFVVIAIIGMVILSGVITESSGMLDNIDPESVVAGWQVLFGIGGVFLGIFGFVVIAALLFFFGIPLVANIFFVVYGIRTYKNRNSSRFKKMAKNDSMYKLIFNGVAVAYCIGTGINIFIEEWSGTTGVLGDTLAAVVFLLSSIPFIVAAVLNISNLVSVKQLEDEPEHIGYNSQYVEQDFSGYENDIWNSYENQNSNSDVWK